jgi:hypothetical protein
VLERQRRDLDLHGAPPRSVPEHRPPHPPCRCRLARPPRHVRVQSPGLSQLQRHGVSRVGRDHSAWNGLIRQHLATHCVSRSSRVGSAPEPALRRA